MPKEKLILICQSSGEFVTNNDGSLSYTGGEAHAVNIKHDTLFNDLKLKLAEMWNLECETLFIKYFLPGNRRTLINLSSNKDLKRMIDFHRDSVTADIFVTGRQGFSRNALEIDASRASEIKLAETVNHIAVSTTAATSFQTFAAALVDPKVESVVTTTPHTAPLVIDTTVPPTDPIPSCTLVDVSVSTLAEAISQSSPTPTFNPTAMDMTCTPADTVKKRRRTPSWKIGANGPTIVSVTDNVGEKIPVSLEMSIQSQNSVTVVDDVDQHQDIVVSENDIKTPSSLLCSVDISLDNLVASWKDGITGVGQEFKSVYEFRDALQKYAIAHRFVYRLKKNDTNRASGRCVTEGCSWRIHASLVPSEKVFKIKKMNDSHTCGGESWKSAHLTKNWLVSVIKDGLRDTPHRKPKEIANRILQDFGVELNYTQVWRGMEDARKLLQGSYKDAYDQLPLFCEKIVETNPGSVAKLITDDEKRFQRLFISFQASIQGFHNGCRPLLFLDATSLKSKYQEILLVATAVDGNDGFFPVAFAIVDVENDGNWHWFLEELKSLVSTSRSLTFISDRKKGLEKSVLEVFENAYNGYSIYHLKEDFIKNLKGPFHGDGKGSLPINFLAAAHALRFDIFNKFTQLIKRVSSEAYNWVMQIEPESWTTSLFKGERYNHFTVNVAESYTKVIEEAREVPIIQKIEALKNMMTELMSNCRMGSSKWCTKLTPSKEVKLQEESKKARGLKVLFSSDTLFEVHDDSINVVNLVDWDCSCMGWKATGLPCRHAIAVFNCKGLNVYDYCSKYFTVTSYRSMYAESIKTVPSIGKAVDKDKENDGTNTVIVLPPSILRPLSQQKRKRSENGMNRRVVSCTVCKEAGHNKATCKATL